MDSSQTTERTVLVALDGSPAALTAVPVARLIASQLMRRLAVVHVASQPIEPGVEALTQRSADELKKEEIRVHIGDPATTILRLTEDPQVALVVLTTHGRLVQPGRLLGGVAEAVAASTTQPVLLVRPESTVAPGAPVSELKHPLLPVDGMPETAESLRPALQLAERLGASVDLLFVVTHDHAVVRRPGSIAAPSYVDQPQHEWPHWANEMINNLLSHCGVIPSGVALRAFFIHGDIGAEITQFAAAHQVDAIVLVRRSNLEPGRAGVLRTVLNTTPCPAFLIGQSDTPSAN